MLLDKDLKDHREEERGLVLAFLIRCEIDASAAKRGARTFAEEG